MMMVMLTVRMFLTTLITALTLPRRLQGATEFTALYALSHLIFTITPQQVSLLIVPVLQSGKPRHGGEAG